MCPREPWLRELYCKLFICFLLDTMMRSSPAYLRKRILIRFLNHEKEEKDLIILLVFLPLVVGHYTASIVCTWRAKFYMFPLLP